MTTTSTSSSIDSLWGFDFIAPQATQDSDLLKHLTFVPGLKEMLMLRQVHALEHATVWVLSNAANFGVSNAATSLPPLDNKRLGGLSTDQGFYLYGQVNTAQLHYAVRNALQRLTHGEWNLAVHPRCGTNFSVNLLVTAGLVLGAHLILPRSPIEQILGFGVAATAAAQLTPDLGSLAQRYITTSIPFNLEIGEITQKADVWGRSAHFVRVRWKDLQ